MVWVLIGVVVGYLIGDALYDFSVNDEARKQREGE